MTLLSEVRRRGSRKVTVAIDGEWIGETLNGTRRDVAIRCADAANVKLAPQSLDAVFTDPPYFGNVQYGELMDFCYVWLRRLVGNKAEGFDRPSTRSPDELTGNVTEERGLEHFTDGLSAVYSRMAVGLKPGAPPGFHLPPQQVGSLLCSRRGDPRRRPCLFRIAALPGGNGAARSTSTAKRRPSSTRSSYVGCRVRLRGAGCSKHRSNSLTS